MAFNINDFIQKESGKPKDKKEYKVKMISAYKLKSVGAEKNFYACEDEDVEKLARTIELVGEIEQPLVVTEADDTDIYNVLAGEKRLRATMKLLQEGKKEYEMIPCKVETVDDIRNELVLIFTNSTQRVRSDFDKMHEAERVRELLTEYQKNHELTGRKQEIIAEILGVSKTKVGTLDNINHNLIAEFKEEYKAGKITTAAANEIAGMSEEKQRELLEQQKKKAEEGQQITQKDVKAAKKEEKAETEGYTDFEPDPDKIERLCVSCLHWKECDQKSDRVVDCKDYVNKVEAYKTDEEKAREAYDAEQAAIDKQTKKALQEKAQAEKMASLPSDAGRKVHEIKLASIYFDDVRSGKKSFELRKNDRGYKVGHMLDMRECDAGKYTGRSIKAEIVYMIEDYTGLQEGYSILGILVQEVNLEKEGD